ncbi:MAG: prohibitin family protein [Candidatus Eisenbacteria bacterium]|nr:prohibitin family protein [Candidatus Eisenbacteria bacterium]
MRGPGTGPLYGLLGVVAVILLLSNLFTVVPAGNVGVLDTFGIVSGRALPAGINMKNPFARCIKMPIKTQELKETMDVPSKEGLSVQLEASVLFHLDPTKAPEIYKTVGRNYVEVLLEPQFRSVTRGVTSLYEAKALYTSVREELAMLVTKDLGLVVGPRGILIENTPLRKVTLPQGLMASIEEKLRAEQESQRMQFVLTKEKQEAERKRIEAQGISDFQTIVTRGISDNLLRWKGIEATLEIAKSTNAKVVIVGSGKDGLPIIMDTK